MSDFGAVATAILSAVGSAITLGGSSDGALSYGKIPADQFPFAMVYNPIKKITRRPFRHGLEETATPLTVVWRDETIANVNAAVVLIEAQIASDPTLGGVVEDAWISIVGRDDGLDTEYTAAVFQVDTVGSI